ncbi:MAG: dTMP kinase [candidate division WOR-3 bacterium]|nr:dTMP kinase [candidate division WOR-3 bacterium]
MPRRGLFITFEGVEGSGKTTQAKALAEWFEEQGYPCLLVRDPGTTAIGEKIRDILLNPENSIHPKCEVLLFLAARSQLVYEKILPALMDKKIVISDRFFDSTYAYQVYARNLPERLIAIFNRFASAGLKPDLTFLVDLDIPEGRARGKCTDRMEQESFSYHRDVRDGYLRLARRAKKRIKILDGRKQVDELKAEVINYVKELLERKGYRI